MKKLVRSVGILLCVLFFLEQMHMCFGGGNSSSGCIDGERRALLKLKRSFQDPSRRLASWEGEDCCRWSGVSCHTRTGHVVLLDLRNSMLPQDGLRAEQVDSSLGELTLLEYLDLSYNSFHSSRIPDFFGSFKHLTYLNLSNSWFGGGPSQFGNLSSLKVLDLSMSIGMHVDDMQWASRLVSLQHLDMSGVYLTKAIDLIPSLSKLPSLLHLQLHGCGIRNIHFSGVSINSTFLATIRSLDLSGNDLQGEIPNVIHNMTALTKLDLGYQAGYYDVSRGLKSENLQWISSLSSLQYLDMVGVDMGEAYKSFQVLYTLPSLLHLRLSYCRLQSTHFSYAISNFTFSRLHSLYLNSNQISGPIPLTLRNMTKLRELDLSSNMFNSTVPQGLVASKSLVHLNIDSNEFDNFEGGVSSMLNNACSLKSIDLSFNPFVGLVLGSNKNSSRCTSYRLESLSISYTKASSTIPDLFGELKNLKHLALVRNLFSGPIPSSVIELPWLSWLDLSYNQFSGDVPDPFWAKFSSLKYLDISHNHLNGTIPRALGRFSRLERLDLSDNQLNGTIPRDLRRLSRLEFLDLSNNKLNGNIPRSVGKLSHLKSLNLAFNNLGWKVESDWAPSFSLQTLNLSLCRIGPKFPQWLQTQKEIIELDLSNADISGSFEQGFQSASLQNLDLSMNQISGESLAQIFEAAPNSRKLLLRNNSISGSIPNSLCKLESLTILDVSRNNISGKIPNCFTESQSFNIINLAFNHISGKIPNSLGQLAMSLARFHVNHNTLEGGLPLSMQNLTNLRVLDLGDNKFSGSIPSWIGERLLSLQILRLGKNRLNNTIPPELCKLSDVQLLDLSDNMLVGQIPHCIGNLKKMITTALQHRIPRFSDPDYEWKMVHVSASTKGLEDLQYTKVQLQLLNLIDLSSNKLAGTIPEEICLLKGLQSLKLSQNQLTGKIPRKIGDLKWLETLDLSHNKLSGEIPPSLSTLSSLSHLNFSYNNLSGKIPSSNQLQTLIDLSIYMGNLHLCGNPLPKICNPEHNNHSIQQQGDGDYDDDAKEKIWFWLIVTAGYATGLWAVFGTLVLKRQWRIAYFSFAESTIDKTLEMAKKFFRE